MITDLEYEFKFSSNDYVLVRSCFGTSFWLVESLLIDRRSLGSMELEIPHSLYIYVCSR